MNKDEIKNYAGQDNFSQRPKMPNYPMLRLNGNDGVFKLVSKNGEKTEESEIAGDVRLVIMRVRRRLADFASGKSTTEHNGTSDNAIVFQWDDETKRSRKIDEGLASKEELRARHPELGTEQILYSLYNGDIVRLIVKGASLGSENKPTGSIPLYDYLASYKSSSDEHVWMYNTFLSSIGEMNKKLKKKYYAISFKRGDLLTPEELSIVGEHMKALHAIFLEQDEYNNIKGRKVNPAEYSSKKILGVDDKPVEELPSIDLEEEEIKPEDIPF